MSRSWVRYCLFVLALVAALMLAPSGATAQITGTSHDFSSVAPGGQLCIACHAPHHVLSTTLLWNHTLSANNFSWSDATETSGGTALPTNIKTWSGSTKNCLGCHDGSVEIGSIIEPPTSFDSTKITGGHQIGGGGDLAGNHPVAVPYPYNQQKNTYNGITTGDFVTLTEFQAVPTKVKIFADSSAAGPTNRGIECASCHNPHGTAFVPFLRDDTTGSAICLDCHIK